MTAIENVLADIDTPPDTEGWRPRRIAADHPDAAAIVNDLRLMGRIRVVHDTLEDQLMELIETRCPSEDLDEAALRERMATHLSGRAPAEYGTWVHYPWSGRLVHVLPEAEFRELRTSRNRNKITAEEQARLGETRIGVVGLSVGQATALTLAMESVAGELRLADFDRLSLSNTNRLRAGVHTVGLNKAVLAAREIVEIDPYARLRVFPEGITETNVDAFFEEGGRLDLLVEECDDLYMKIHLREQARHRCVPVIMETSDRGLLDVERFDREPERPILHGLAAGLVAEDLKGLETDEKVPIILRILGQTAVSPRLAASMVEVKTTLKTWPQLASSVTLGSAVATDVARRILLGQFQDSGRFYVDLDQIVADGAAVDIQVKPDATEAPEEATRPLEAPGLSLRTGSLTEAQVRTLTTYATMAFSGGNCQPWRFEYGGGTLVCIHDVARSESYLDFGHRASYLAFGSVAENVHLAAMQMGFDAVVRPFPDAADPTRVCEIDFRPREAEPVDGTLFEQIPLRVTNRKLGPRESLSPDDAAAFEAAARDRGARLYLLQDTESLARMGDLLGRGDRIRFLSKVMHGEMMSEIRWSPEEAAATRDGLDVATLELTPKDLAGMRMTASWRVMDLVGRVGGGRALEKPSRKAVAAAAAVGLVSLQGDGPLSFFEGGRATQRIWLSATARGWAFQPMTAITYLWLRLAHDPASIDDRARAELEALRAEHEALFAVDPGAGEGMLFRLSRAEPPTARSLRRRVDDVLSFV